MTAGQEDYINRLKVSYNKQKCCCAVTHLAVWWLLPHLQVHGFDLVKCNREGIQGSPGRRELEGCVPLHALLDLLHTLPLEVLDLKHEYCVSQ